MPLILEDDPAAGVRRLRLNRPEARNALSDDLRRDLALAVDAAAADPAVRVLVLAGSEGSFAAGADLKALVGRSPVEMHRAGYHRYWASLSRCPKPIVAAVRGYALGGGAELALHADLVVTCATARFGFPEVRVGIMPGAGGTQRLVRLVGRMRAMRLLTTGEIVTGDTAFDWGMVSHLVDPERVEDEALVIASRLAAGPALALEFIKELVTTGPDLPLDAALTLERRSMHLLFATADQKEGMAAFLETRKPGFE